MPRSDAIPLDQAPSQAPIGRAAAVPLDQPAPTTSAAMTPVASPQSWSDYLHNFSVGLANPTRVATDAPTLGLMDKIFGPQAQADTATAYQQAGKAAIPLALAGSMVTGQGELAGAKAIGEAAAPYVGRWAGGVLGTGTVGGGTSALGAYGHEAGWTPDAGDIARQGTVGTALGLLAGFPGGVVGRGGTLPAAVSKAQLAENTEKAYAPLEDMWFNGRQLDNHLSPIDAQKSPYQAEVTPQTTARLNALRGQPGVTGADIQDAQRTLGKISNGVGSSILDAHFAGQYSKALDNVLQNETPIWGGAAANAPPMQPGVAATVKAAGDTAFGREADAARIAGWEKSAAVPGGPDVGASAKNYLLSDEGQRLAPQGSPQNAMFSKLAATARPMQAPGLTPGPWDIRHAIGHALEPALIGIASGGLGGGGIEAARGGGWGDIAAATGAGLLSGYVLHKGVPFLLSRSQQAGQQAALNAAKVGVSLGQDVAPVLPAAPKRALIRQGILSAGSSGAY